MGESDSGFWILDFGFSFSRVCVATGIAAPLDLEMAPFTSSQSPIENPKSSVSSRVFCLTLDKNRRKPLHLLFSVLKRALQAVGFKRQPGGVSSNTLYIPLDAAHFLFERLNLRSFGHRVADVIAKELNRCAYSDGSVACFKQPQAQALSALEKNRAHIIQLIEFAEQPVES